MAKSEKQKLHLEKLALLDRNYQRTKKFRTLMSKIHKGKKISKEHIEKLKSLVGEKSPAWKGGITPANTKVRNSIQYRLWRESVFARDNWTCQECSQRGGELEAHHIKSFREYPELRFTIDNGITFCIACHKIMDN